MSECTLETCLKKQQGFHLLGVMLWVPCTRSDGLLVCPGPCSQAAFLLQVSGFSNVFLETDVRG